MDNNLEDFHPTMEESCGSAESSPRRSKMKRNEWSESRIIMPFVPLEAIKEELTPCSSTQRLENNLSLIKNKLRSGSDASPVHRDQRTQLCAQTNTRVENLNVIHANRATNLNYNVRNNLYNIKSKIQRKSSSRSSVNDGRLSNIDSSRDASESNDEIYSRSTNICPVKPARKSVNTQNGKTISSVPSSARNAQRNVNDIVVSKNSTPRSMKYNSCIDELKYYNVRNGLSKNPSEESSARKVSSQAEDDELSRSNSGLATGRTDCTDISVFNNKENTHESKENSSGNNTTLNEKNNSLDVTDMSVCNTKDFKHYLMHSDNKTSSTTNSMNLTESEPNSPDIPTDICVKQQESARGIKSKSAQEKTRIPKKDGTENVVNKNPSKDLPGSGLKYKIGVPKNKPNVNRNDSRIETKKVRAKSEDASSHSTKLKTEMKGKEAKYRTQKAEDICTTSKSQPVAKPLKNATQTKFKQDSSKITKPTTIDSKDIGDNSTRKTNSTARRRYSMGESFVTHQERHKKILETPRAEEKPRRTTTYMDDNQKRQKETPPTDQQAEMTRRKDDDCYSKPSDLSLKSSDSLQIVGRRIDCCPSTDGIAGEMSDNSEVRRDILEMASTNQFLRQRDADDRHLGMGDFSEYSFATMDYCAACNNYSDLSTQDSFSTNTKDTWTQVHFSDIIKEMKRQMKKNKTADEAEVQYSRHDNTKNRKARSANTVRNERTGQYRRGREMHNFNYDKPVENYLINSSRRNTVRRYAHDDDTTFDCCGCMRFSFFRRIFNRSN